MNGREGAEIRKSHGVLLTPRWTFLSRRWGSVSSFETHTHYFFHMHHTPTLLNEMLSEGDVVEYTLSEDARGRLQSVGLQRLGATVAAAPLSIVISTIVVPSLYLIQGTSFNVNAFSSSFFT